MLELLLRLDTSVGQGNSALLPLLMSFSQVAQFVPSAFGVSPSGQYVAGTERWWRTEDGLRVGAVVLIDVAARRVLREAEAERPEVLSVADSGRVLLEDWGWESLRSSVSCFSRTGELLWQHSFEANTCRSGISSDGECAFVATAENRKWGRDSCQVFVFDGESGALLWRRTLYPPCAPHLHFEFRDRELYVVDEERSAERLVRNWLHPDD